MLIKINELILEFVNVIIKNFYIDNVIKNNEI